VVNAELSFTLEQVPEWTVNDGAFVDVARPGRRPLQEEVAANLGQTGQAGQAGQSGEEETTQRTTGAGEDGGQKPGDQNKPQATGASFNTCKQLQELKLNGVGFNPIPGSNVLSGGGRIGEERGLTNYESRFGTNINSYSAIVAKGTSLGVTTSGECTVNEIKKLHAIVVNDNSRTKFGFPQLSQGERQKNASVAALNRMKKCSNDLGRRSGTFYVNKGCQRFQSASEGGL
jgi:hypothetical protein